MSFGSNKHVIIGLLVSILFGIITFALVAATLGTLIKRLDSLENQISESLSISGTTAATTASPNPSSLVSVINIDDVMGHLQALQSIADQSGGTRAVSTIGFNRTLDYITNTLRNHTNFQVSSSFFNIRQFGLNSDPKFYSRINGDEKEYKFSEQLSEADFYYVQFSVRSDGTTYSNLTVIPNLGCNASDWSNAVPSPQGRVALVKRGVCAFDIKGALAMEFNVRGLLIYNDGASADRFAPLAVGLGQKNEIPALFLSYQVGKELADAASNGSLNVGVRMIIDTKDLPPSPVGNICADTPTGDPTQTIVIGSHSDSVLAGPGINDNGSGSAANLGLAIALARLFQSSNYAKYPYRVRFCWWGAEEIGLLGSRDHVAKAKLATEVGERLSDYLINLNYDMLGSPNFIYGIYDGRTARNDTPTSALAGSNRITALFKDWFDGQNLPWTYTDFSGRSDYGPFLAEGIVAGGLFSGADERKTIEQRDYYDKMLGQGLGGIAGAIQDPCYHQACDSIQNINVLAYEKMVQAAAYVLEYLGKQTDLKLWLYPSAKFQRLSTVTRPRRPYNSINTYFGLADA